MSYKPAYYIPLGVVLLLAVVVAGCTLPGAMRGTTTWHVDAGESITISGDFQPEAIYWDSVLGYEVGQDTLHFYLFATDDQGRPSRAAWDKTYLFGTHEAGAWTPWEFTYTAPSPSIVRAGNGWRYDYTDMFTGEKVYVNTWSAIMMLSNYAPEEVNPRVGHGTYTTGMTQNFLMYCHVPKEAEYTANTPSRIIVDASPDFDIARVEWSYSTPKYSTGGYIIAGNAPITLSIPSVRYKSPTDKASVNIRIISPGGYEGRASVMLAPESTASVTIELEIPAILPTTTGGTTTTTATTTAGATTTRAGETATTTTDTGPLGIPGAHPLIGLTALIIALYVARKRGR